MERHGISPLRTKPAPANFPAPLSAFIGRGREIAEVTQLLSAHRLVTLTGAGGSGKTRLAIKVAGELSGEFQHGIWFVELASVFDPAFVPQTIAAALKVREQAGQAVMEVILDYLSGRDLLLIIDNCEHLIPACAQFAESTLQNCPGLKIIATSREALQITGEAAWSVPPLSLPSPQPWTSPAGAQEALRRYRESESVQLFAARAAAISADFTLTAECGGWVAEICRHLDGMPLAIELAAARVRVLSVRQIAERLDERFQLLTGGSRTAPPRQQTLAATLDWSYALLSDQERKVLQRLSIFAGGVALEAAESACSDDGVEAGEMLDLLTHLVDKSLVLVDKSAEAEARYRLLETIRQYARQKLQESGQASTVSDRHLEYFLQWAEKTEPYLLGPELRLGVQRFETEHDNLRAALDWSQHSPGKAEAGLRLAGAAFSFWRVQGYHREGRMRFSTLLAHRDAQAPTMARATALFRASALAFYQSDYPSCRALGEQSLEIFQKQGPSGRLGVADALEMLAEVAAETGDHRAAFELYEKALPIYEELGDLVGIGDTLKMLGWSTMRTGNYEQAEARLEQALIVCRQSGEQRQIASALSSLGELAVRTGRYEDARNRLNESLMLSRSTGEKWALAIALGSLGWVALLQRDYKQMAALLRESLSIRLETGDRGGMAWCLEKLAQAAALQDDPQRAATLLGAASALRAPVNSVVDAADQPEYDRLLSSIRAALGEQAHTACWADGEGMSLETMVDYALREPQRTLAESARLEKERYGGLTSREREVAAWIAQGKSNREIAEAMTVGVKTVETYVTRILDKLGVESRVQIAIWAKEQGLPPPAAKR